MKAKDITKLGNKRVITEVCVEQECEECGEPARYKHTFLLEGSRRNPQSNGYGKDDISWCSDEEKFACEEHNELVRRNAPRDMSWCSTFPRNDRFEHMFLWWQKISEEHPQ